MSPTGSVRFLRNPARLCRFPGEHHRHQLPTMQNNLDNMTKWISDPQSVAPGNAMPNMGIKPADARAIAVYLATLREEK